MIVDCMVWVWHPRRMLSVADARGSDAERYITVHDAERLLEEAHKRGYQQCTLELRTQKNDL